MKHSPRIPRIPTPPPRLLLDPVVLRTVGNRIRAEDLPEPPALRRAAVLALLAAKRAAGRGACGPGTGPRAA